MPTTAICPRRMLLKASPLPKIARQSKVNVNYPTRPRLASASLCGRTTDTVQEEGFLVDLIMAILDGWMMTTTDGEVSSEHVSYCAER